MQARKLNVNSTKHVTKCSMSASNAPCLSVLQHLQLHSLHHHAYIIAAPISHGFVFHRRRGPPPPSTLTLDPDADDDHPSDQVWFGEPDPDIYQPGTIALTPAQVEEEKRKGNIMTMREFKEQLKTAEPWETEVR